MKKLTEAVQFLLHHHAQRVAGHDPVSADEALKMKQELEDEGKEKEAPAAADAPK